MGMYTELVLKCRISNNAPQQVKAILHRLFNEKYEAGIPGDLPDHPFFKCERWSFIGGCSSFYHIHWHDSKYDEEHGYIFSRSDLKDYDNEIDKFIDWIRPYLDDHRYNCIGWKWYEEDSEPTLIFRDISND